MGGQWTREESNLQVCFPLQSVSMAMVHANCLAWVHLKEVGNTLPIQLDSYQIECRIESFMNHESESSVGYRAAPHPTDFGFGSLACLLCVCVSLLGLPILHLGFQDVGPPLQNHYFFIQVSLSLPLPQPNKQEVPNRTKLLLHL